MSKQTRVVPTRPEPISRGRCTGTGSNLIPSNSRHEGSPCKRLPVVVPQSSGFSRVPSGHDLNYRTPRRASSLSGSRGRTGSRIRRYHAQYCTFDFRLFDQVSDITGCKGTVSLFVLSLYILKSPIMRLKRVQIILFFDQWLISGLYLSKLHFGNKVYQSIFELTSNSLSFLSFCSFWYFEIM